MRKFSAALLDMDGTLIDSNELHVDAWHLAFLTLGLRIRKEVIRKQIGKGADMLVPTLAPQLSHAEQKKIGEHQGKMFRSNSISFVRPFAGAKRLIELLHQRNIKVVIASSSGRTEIDRYIKLLDVENLIHAITSRDEVDHSKPAPDIFLAAMRKIAPIRPRQVIAVGDTPYDGIAATQCGIYTIGLRSGGFSDQELLGSGMSVIYDGIADIGDALLKSRDPFTF